MARPSKYKPELVAEICKRLAQGEPLTVICRSSAKFPDPSTVRDWMEAMPDVSLAIARAREAGEDVIAEQCLMIADSTCEGEETEVDALGKVVKIKRGDMLGHRKLQIETRLKLLAKWNPKKWADRQNLEHSGHLNLAPLSITINDK